MKANSTPAMRFLVFGMGAIGTYVGGSLALSGQEVVFLDRAEVAAAVRERGLRLQFPTGERIISAPIVVTSQEEAFARGPYQLAILAVKSFDTLSLLKNLQIASNWLPPLLCLQNGVENEGLVEATFGKDHVVPASVTTAIGRKAAGNIVIERLRGIGIASDQPFIPGLIEILNAAGLKARRYSDPNSMKWSKMLTNLLANASSAILDLPPSAIFMHPGLYRMELTMLKEALAVMDAQQIPVSNLPGTPVRLLVWVGRAFPPSISQPILANSLGKGRGLKMPSFHQDLYSGRSQSEVYYLNGAIARFGDKFGVPAPVNRWLNKTLIAMSSGVLHKDTYAHNPEKMLTAISRNTKGG